MNRTDANIAIRDMRSRLNRFPRGTETVTLTYAEVDLIVGAGETLLRDVYRCSACGRIFQTAKFPGYGCPNCEHPYGPQMDEIEEWPR